MFNAIYIYTIRRIITNYLTTVLNKAYKYNFLRKINPYDKDTFKLKKITSNEDVRIYLKKTENSWYFTLPKISSSVNQFG